MVILVAASRQRHELLGHDYLLHRAHGFVKKTAEASTEALVLAGGGCCVGEVSKKVGTRAARGTKRAQGGKITTDHVHMCACPTLSLHLRPRPVLLCALTCAPATAGTTSVARPQQVQDPSPSVRQGAGRQLAHPALHHGARKHRSHDLRASGLPPAQRHGLQRARGGTWCTVCSPTATSWRAHLWA